MTVPEVGHHLAFLAPGASLRRLALVTLCLGTTGGAVWLLADVLASDGLNAIETMIVALFAVNFVWITVSFYTGLAGLYLRVANRDPVGLYRQTDTGGIPRLCSRTVVVIPIHNEDPLRVFAGLRASYESLRRTGQCDRFDFFVLSDTRDPDIWIAEELAWADTCEALDARGQIFYRRRAENAERKAGNLRDFCENWAAAYDHMIVFDADSVMSGHAMVRLAALMEQNPGAGIIQSSPLPTGHTTLFARILQFIARVHGPTMTAGFAFWQLDDSNYWGHNAIIRTRAFIDCCGLPVLSGKPPLGGPILSHDFVEAALMRRAGWQVWLAPDIGGSWEELPPTLVGYASRDRRWCQGNLQHARLLGARGFAALSRLHLCMGIMSFASSPLWLMLLLTATAAAVQSTGLQYDFFPDQVGLFPVWPIDRSGEMVALLAFTLGMLVLPKLLSTLLLAIRADERRGFGGAPALLASALLEMIYAALQAPVMMLLHTRFVVAILCGREVDWVAQRRDDEAVAIATAFWLHRWHLLWGLVWSGIALGTDVGFFWWLSPVLAGLVAAPLLTRLSSSTRVGSLAARGRLFLTPEETTPPEELCALARFRQQSPADDLQDGLVRLIEDPFASALHTALLPAQAPDARTAAEVSIIYEKLARLGVDALTTDEKTKILSYPVKPLDQVLAGRTAAAPDIATLLPDPCRLFELQSIEAHRPDL